MRISDESSDVCSSDLRSRGGIFAGRRLHHGGRSQVRGCKQAEKQGTGQPQTSGSSRQRVEPANAPAWLPLQCLSAQPPSLTRRSIRLWILGVSASEVRFMKIGFASSGPEDVHALDRKSTRLNSSH